MTDDAENENKTTTDSDGPHLKRGLRRFRHVARLVAIQLKWIKGLPELATEHLKPYVIDGPERAGDDPESPRKSFNVDGKTAPSLGNVSTLAGVGTTVENVRIPR